MLARPASGARLSFKSIQQQKEGRPFGGPLFICAQPECQIPAKSIDEFEGFEESAIWYRSVNLYSVQMYSTKRRSWFTPPPNPTCAAAMSPPDAAAHFYFGRSDLSERLRQIIREILNSLQTNRQSNNLWPGTGGDFGLVRQLAVRR